MTAIHGRTITRGPLRDLPEKWAGDLQWESYVLDWLQRRLIALVVISRLRDRSAPPRGSVITGFALEANGAMLWVSAGHALEELDLLRQQPGTEIVRARWHDIHAEVPGGIPADLSSMPLEYGTGDAPDVGIVRLGRIEADLLRANPRFEAFTPDDHGLDIGDAEPLGGVIFGYPLDWVDEKLEAWDGRAALDLTASPVAVKLCEPVDPTKQGSDPFWQRGRCIYARINIDRPGDERMLESIVGLSGGPAVVLARRRDGVVIDRVLGIQSIWLPGRQIVRIEPLDVVLHYLALVNNTETASTASDRVPPASSERQRDV